MARFRGTTKGNRGEASRLGHTNLTSSADGWDVGARLHAQPAPPWLADGAAGGRLDVIYVTATNGSNGHAETGPVGVIVETASGAPPLWVPWAHWPGVAADSGDPMARAVRRAAGLEPDPEPRP